MGPVCAAAELPLLFWARRTQGTRLMWRTLVGVAAVATSMLAAYGWTSTACCWRRCVAGCASGRGWVCCRAPAAVPAARTSSPASATSATAGGTAASTSRRTYGCSARWRLGGAAGGGACPDGHQRLRTGRLPCGGGTAAWSASPDRHRGRGAHPPARGARTASRCDPLHRAGGVHWPRASALAGGRGAAGVGPPAVCGGQEDPHALLQVLLAAQVLGERFHPVPAPGQPPAGGA